MLIALNGLLSFLSMNPHFFCKTPGKSDIPSSVAACSSLILNHSSVLVHPPQPIKYVIEAETFSAMQDATVIRSGHSLSNVLSQYRRRYGFNKGAK
jgi:hypothetical protein